MSLNLTVILEEGARRHPAKPALVLGEHRLTYLELLGASRKLASSLASLGISPGDHVAVMVPNVPQFVIAYYGILSLGAVVVPLNILFREREIVYHLRDSDSTTLVVWDGFLADAQPAFEQVPECRHLIVVESPAGERVPEGALSFNGLLAQGSPAFDTYQTTPDSTAVILYTSGTTGRPKGAELTHFNLFANAAISADKVLGLTERDSVLAALPLFHVFGQTCALNVGLYINGTVALMPRFDPEQALRVVEALKLTIFTGVPTMYQYLLAYPDAERFDFSSVRMCITGGSAMPVEVLHAIEQRFPTATVLEGYGLSETSPVVCVNRSREVRRVGSVGLPIWGTEVRIVDADGNAVPRGEPGELLVRGHPVMKGYYKRPEDTEEAIRNGWFHTGDVARMDEDGYVYIVDRIKDMIIRSGFNVYPREVEEVLYEHPAVAECAVIGIPDAIHGEEVLAVIVPRTGQHITEQEIIEFAKQRMAAYKYPRSVVFVEQMPKTATGKILKRELVSAARQAQQQAIG